MEPGRRFYLVFSREKRLRFLSHLDMMRLWERALRRAGLPLRYSQGYHPHPRLSLALPLAVGMTAAAEWLEIETQFPVRPEEIEQRLPSQLPIGTTLHEVREAPWQVPSLAAQLQGAEYEVAVRSSLSLEEVQEKVGRFLATETWPLEEQRKGKARTSDLRKGVEELEVGEWAAGSGQLRMVLHHNAGAHARPDALVQALGLGSRTMVHRRRLLFGSSTDSCLGN